MMGARVSVHALWTGCSPTSGPVLERFSSKPAQQKLLIFLKLLRVWTGRTGRTGFLNSESLKTFDICMGRSVAIP